MKKLLLILGLALSGATLTASEKSQDTSKPEQSRLYNLGMSFINQGLKILQQIELSELGEAITLMPEHKVFAPVPMQETSFLTKLQQKFATIQCKIKEKPVLLSNGNILMPNARTIENNLRKNGLDDFVKNSTIASDLACEKLSMDNIISFIDHALYNYYSQKVKEGDKSHNGINETIVINALFADDAKIRDYAYSNPKIIRRYDLREGLIKWPPPW